MKSSIKIDFIDRGTGVGIEPVIRIELIKSEDPRDTLISVLFESVAYNKFLKISYPNKPIGEASEAKTILLFKPSMDNEEKEIARQQFEATLQDVLALVPDKKTKQILEQHHRKHFEEGMANCL